MTTDDPNLTPQRRSRGELSYVDVERLARQEVQAFAAADPAAATLSTRSRRPASRSR